MKYKTSTEAQNDELQDFNDNIETREDEFKPPQQAKKTLKCSTLLHVRNSLHYCRKDVSDTHVVSLVSGHCICMEISENEITCI